jgi:hypothetical protein
MAIRPVERLAFAEFARSWGYSSGAPGGRDFVSLSIFFVLSSFFLFLGIAAQEGARHRFEQVMLGALPASGPPIRLGAHFERPEALTPELLERFVASFPHLHAVPTRTFDGQTGVLAVPGFETSDQPAGSTGQAASPPAAMDASQLCQRLRDKGVAWTCSAQGDIPTFRGLAISRESPLWSWIAQKGAERGIREGQGGLVVAASRAMFDKHFQFERYRRAVVENIRVPCHIRQDLHVATAASSGFPTIVLRLREGTQRPESYHLARVIWIDSFPVDNVAMILPLERYEPLLATQGRLGVGLYPEADGSSRRITKISLPDLDLIEPPSERDRLLSAFRTFSACLGAVELGSKIPPSTDKQLSCAASLSDKAATAGDLQILPRLNLSGIDASLTVSPEWALRHGHVLACAMKAGIAADFGPTPTAPLPPKSRVREEYTPSSTEVRWRSSGRLELPCAVLGPDDAPCSGSEKGEAQLDGYRETSVYVKRAALDGSNRRSLDNIVDDLLRWKPDGRPVFRLDAAYEGALVRFGVLSTLLDVISTPIGFGALAMYLALLAIMTMTTFAHRRPQYGLLLMNGMRGGGVAWLVSCQIVMCSVVGGMIGLALFGIASNWVNGALRRSEIIESAKNRIGLDIPLFIDVPKAATLFGAWTGMTALAVVIGAVVLFGQGVATAQAPITLIKK